MSFKLLAIRPLHGTSPELLKSLKENTIYQFYNEYSFVLDENTEIYSIDYNPSTPSNLFGKNINISAIVGENGSGKSSLMELFYYGTLLYNQTNIGDSENNISGLESACCVEFVLLKNTQTIQVINISYKNANLNELKLSSTFYKTEEQNSCLYKKCVDPTLENIEFDFYTNVLNYSIYGLNSNTLPWLEEIFYKNDGYQLPIVINPFKEYGNYDINKEYMLMQARAIFYTNVLGLKEIINDVYIHEVHFEIELDKILKIEKQRISTLEVLNNFFKISISEERYNSLLFKKESDVMSLDIIRNNIPYISFSEGDERLACKDVLDKNLLERSEFYKAIVYLYIFKKLYKISKTYSKFRKFHFLFSDELPYDLNFKNEKLINYLKYNISSDDSEKHKKEIIFENLILELDLFINNDQVGLINDDAFYFKELFKNFYEVRHDKKSNIDIYLSDLSFDSSNILNNIEPTRKLIMKLFNGIEFREFLFNKYVEELNNDNSHITFKLKQSLNYFKNNIFGSIEIDKSKVVANKTECKIFISITNAYFRGKNKIEDIPLAVFNHSLMVVKSKEKDENERNKLIQDQKLESFSYTSLSSGEQHLMNSMLTIAYHIYNLLSVEYKSSLKKYKNINLIFDELELYLHPEFQRKYIKNLITLIDRIREKTKHDDIQYNVLMVTHSPFILSDIPSENVLKLKNGIPIKDKDGINSFGANIHDLLADEFFLDKGSKGAYVDSIINRFMEFYYLTKLSLLKQSIDNFDDIFMKLTEYENIFKLIGDPVIKSILGNNILKLKNLILNEKV